MFIHHSQFERCPQNSSISSVNNRLGQMEEEEDEDQEQIFESSENSSQCNWINLCSDKNTKNYNYNDSDENENAMKQVQFQIVPILPKMSSSLHIFTGLFLTDDGNLRYTTSLDAVSFGFEQQQVQKVQEIKKLNVVDINYKIEKNYILHSIQDAIKYAYNTNQVQFQQIAGTIMKIQDEYEAIESLKINFDERILLEKEEEFDLFKQTCFQYLESYVEQNPNTMFKYNIERLNLYTQDSEISHTGYSKSFLELIGLDPNSLVQLLNRHKKIDLLRNKFDVTNQTIYCLEDMSCSSYPSTEVISHIVTFDGFPIRLYQKQRTIKHGFKENIFEGDQCSYSLSFNEIDVDFNDLEQLILYRQNLVTNGQNLSVDDFIRKELSFLFEDVEYSIHSQDFIDKYYNLNLKQLQELKQSKLNQKITCKYKCIQNSSSLSSSSQN